MCNLMRPIFLFEANHKMEMLEIKIFTAIVLIGAILLLYGSITLYEPITQSCRKNS